MLSKQWARNFAVRPDDIDSIQGLLLEREQPLSIEEIARFIVQSRLQEEQEAFAEQFRSVTPYRPAEMFEVGQRLVFPKLDFALATVVHIREGVNPEMPRFQVIGVQFEDGTQREFAAALAQHSLNTDTSEGMPVDDAPNVEDILSFGLPLIGSQIEEALAAHPDFIRLGKLWFARALMLPIDEGHLHLADAVLDIASGGPLTAEAILDEIGGVGSGSRQLQVFSLNHALNNDERFDEVGPLDTVLWYLRRYEPLEVQRTPEVLQYTPIPYDESSLTDEQQTLEMEIDDEWSLLEDQEMNPLDKVRLILIYPHRRAGTLPLTARMRGIFPTARRSSRIALRLVDGQDGEEFPGWVVREGRYVFGLSRMYAKHKLPVGAFISVQREANTDRVVVNFQAHRPRSEYVRLIVNRNGQYGFEDTKRPIGAEYDDLVILGADDLAFVDSLFQSHQGGKKTLTGILRTLLSELSRSSTQGTVHAKTLYSALNVLRRCPPAPMLAALNNEPDFTHVGNHYWRLGG
jgi:hypothetical protein